MVIRHLVKDYEPFIKFMSEFDARGEIVIIKFTGSDMANGESWCDDCVRAYPVIEEALEKFADPKSHFIEVKVGDRAFWKDMNCPFRKDSNLRLMVLPTILKWKTHQRLEGNQCEKLELLELLLTED